MNGNVLTVTLENNSSAKSLYDRLSNNDLTIYMEEYGDFEKVGSLGFSLPTNDESIITTSGDIVLYQGNQLTIHYGSNRWSYTRLGKIHNITQEELKEILGNSNVTITLSLNK